MDGDDELFRSLADPTRRALLDALLTRDGQTLFELCARMHDAGVGSSRQAIAQHLDVLAASGLVRIRRQGRYRLHDLDTTPLRPLRERWLRPHERTHP